MKRNNSGSLKLIIVLVIAFLLLRGCSEAGSSPYGVLMGFVSFAFWSGLVVCLIVLAITAAVIWFTVKDKKYRGKHDPPNVTPQAAREAAEAKAKARAEAERAKAAAGADAAKWFLTIKGNGSGHEGSSAQSRNFIYPDPAGGFSAVYGAYLL